MTENISELPSYEEAAQPDGDPLPELDALPPPKQLMGRRPPYLIILQIRDRTLKLHATHTPSLELIKSYFEKHTRRDHYAQHLVGSCPA